VRLSSLLMSLSSLLLLWLLRHLLLLLLSLLLRLRLICRSRCFRTDRARISSPLDTDEGMLAINKHTGAFLPRALVVTGPTIGGRLTLLLLSLSLATCLTLDPQTLAC
jgi:hypothetical protein